MRGPAILAPLVRAARDPQPDYAGNWGVFVIAPLADRVQPSLRLMSVSEASLIIRESQFETDPHFRLTNTFSWTRIPVDGGAGGVSVIIASFCVFMGILAYVAFPG